MEENRTHLHMLTRLTGGSQVKRWPKYVRNPDVTQVVFATLSHYCWIGIVLNSSTEIEHTQSNPALKFKHWSCAGLFMLPYLKMLFFPHFYLNSGRMPLRQTVLANLRKWINFLLLHSLFYFLTSIHHPIRVVFPICAVLFPGIFTGFRCWSSKIVAKIYCPALL